VPATPAPAGLVVANRSSKDRHTGWTTGPADSDAGAVRGVGARPALGPCNGGDRRGPRKERGPISNKIVGLMLNYCLAELPKNGKDDACQAKSPVEGLIRRCTEPISSSLLSPIACHRLTTSR
jgi:hypothetical protein